MSVFSFMSKPSSTQSLRIFEWGPAIKEQARIWPKDYCWCLGSRFYAECWKSHHGTSTAELVRHLRCPGYLRENCSLYAGKYWLHNACRKRGKLKRAVTCRTRTLFFLKFWVVFECIDLCVFSFQLFHFRVYHICESPYSFLFTSEHMCRSSSCWIFNYVKQKHPTKLFLINTSKYICNLTAYL